ncbi:MAG: hypothetical protein HUU46_15705 [Candidatus Hydrogenedentes bacterium]|nr:hypothetical protein [Candidatus Hydrogenedentota bacterium]
MEIKNQCLPLRGDIVRAVENALGKELDHVLTELHAKGLSASEIYVELRRVSGVQFTRRTLQRWLSALKLEYSRAEAGKQRWARGLMQEAAAKTRRSLIRSRTVGSRVEEQIRWELKSELEGKPEYEAIIGFSNWSILGTHEVDIPIVLIRRTDQRVTKIGIEIDGERFHEGAERWNQKRAVLASNGWHPIRIVVDKNLTKHAWQVYVKNNIRSLVDMEGLLAEIEQTLTEG